MTPTPVLSATLAWVVTLASAASVPAHADGARPCDAATIAVRLDSVTRDGGTLGVRNVGSRACTIARDPRLELRDALGAVISTGRPPRNRFMRPGPAMRPIDLEPGRGATTTLRWPIGNGRPRERGTGGGMATTLAVFPGTGVRTLGVRVHVPPDDDAIVFTQTWLATDSPHEP